MSFDYIPLDYMAIATAILYWMGVYLHYIHFSTVFHLLDRLDEMDVGRTIILSIFWPWTVIQLLFLGLFGRDEDEY